MSSSALININLLRSLSEIKTGKIFYSSSACIYPQENQADPDKFTCEESTAYPANPDSNYGWEKLFSERLFLSYAANYRLDVSIGRYHNIYGPLCCYDGGKEKAPAAIARKVGELANTTGEIEVWGDGKQTRSFLFIDDCIAATRKLLGSNFVGPVNIGSEETISINNLVGLVGNIAGKNVRIKHIAGPQGVRGRSSDNKLIAQRLKWQPSVTLKAGMAATYQWVEKQIEDTKKIDG
jgi:nucleoside-diphosphate-sugar epimerase